MPVDDQGSAGFTGAVGQHVDEHDIHLERRPGSGRRTYDGFCSCGWRQDDVRLPVLRRLVHVHLRRAVDDGAPLLRA